MGASSRQARPLVLPCQLTAQEAIGQQAIRRHEHILQHMRLVPVVTGSRIESRDTQHIKPMKNFPWQLILRGRRYRLTNRLIQLSIANSSLFGY